MWRAIVLGKLIISIIVSIVVSYLCFAQAGVVNDWSETFRWAALGSFFALLSIGFGASLYLLHYRKHRS